MLRIAGILGDADEPRFAGRRLERLPVAYDEASKSRLRRTTESGTDIAISVPRGVYLAEGSVLDDDGERIVVVVRLPAPALVVRFGAGLDPEVLLRQAAMLGHAFGNQHVPLEVAGREVRIPLTTSEQVARATVAALGLEDVEVELVSVALGRQRPLSVGHGHGHHGGAASNSA